MHVYLILLNYLGDRPKRNLVSRRERGSDNETYNRVIKDIGHRSENDELYECLLLHKYSESNFNFYF